MSANSIQFRGKEKVIEAYEYNKIAAWSIMCGKEKLFDYEGDDQEEGADKLGQCIDMLKTGDSDGAYILRVYTNFGKEIMSNTPYKNSFKFKLFDGEEMGGYSALRGMRYRIEDRIELLEKQLKEREIEPEGEENKAVGGILGFVDGMLGRKDVQDFLLAKVVGMAEGLASSIFGKKTMPATVAGIPEQPVNGNEAYQALTDEQKKLLNEAMAILLSKDPEIGTHLHKLAIILRDSPGKYSMYASML